MRSTILRYSIWIIIFECIGFLLGVLTQNHIPDWYAQLNKSTLTPPGFVFSWVWSILYVALAILGAELSQADTRPIFKNEFFIYWIQMGMNWLWTPIFFSLHWIGVGFAWILMIVFLNFILVMQLWQSRKWLVFFALPYLFWLVFASYLNGYIWIFN